jgi:hypothetical protein
MTTEELLEQLIGEVRQTNSLLKLAFAAQVDSAINEYLSKPNIRTVLALLADGEMQTGALIKAAAAESVAQSTAFQIVATLERAGLVARPKRGYVALSQLSAAYVSGLRPPKKGTKPNPTEPEVAEAESGT